MFGLDIKKFIFFAFGIALILIGLWLMLLKLYYFPFVGWNPWILPLLTLIGIIVVLIGEFQIKDSIMDNTKILASINASLGLIAILVGLWIMLSKDPNGLIITGLGAILITIVGVLLSTKPKTVPEEPKLKPLPGKVVVGVLLTTIDDDIPRNDTEQVNTGSDDIELLKTEIDEDKPNYTKLDDYTPLEKSFKFVGILIIIFGLSYVIWVGLKQSNSLMGIGVIGLGSFVVVLAGAFCLSDKWNLHAWEFRKALTISIISVYFSTMAFSNKIITTNISSNVTNLTNTVGFINSAGDYQINQLTMVEPVFNNLWVIVGLVITFYFTTDWINTLKNKDKENKG